MDRPGRSLQTQDHFGRGSATACRAFACSDIALLGVGLDADQECAAAEAMTEREGTPIGIGLQLGLVKRVRHSQRQRGGPV